MENDLKSASQNHLTYEQVHDLIAKHANDMLPLYADGLGRFPNGDPAIKIAARLRTAALFYSDLKNDLSNALDLAAMEIMDRAQEK